MIKKIPFPISALNFNYTFNGGQAFRWSNTADNKWIGVFSHKVWTIWYEDNHIMYETRCNNSCPTKNEEDEQLLRSYFRLDEKLEDLYSEWFKCDIHFEKAGNKFEGVRMLQQDPVEIIFTFICSSNNNIVRIKSMVDKLCSFYGEEITQIGSVRYFDFPAIEKLAQPSVKAKLEKAAFGYRAKYIQSTAEKIMQFGGLLWIEELKKLPYKKAKLELMSLPGIGAKVADCICLMSLNHLEAIPVDTHVFQIATKYYLPQLASVKSVTDRVYNEIGDHFRSLYKKYAGWAHCILFCDELKAFQQENGKKGTKKRKLKVNSSKSVVLSCLPSFVLTEYCRSNKRSPFIKPPKRADVTKSGDLTLTFSLPGIKCKLAVLTTRGGPSESEQVGKKRMNVQK